MNEVISCIRQRRSVRSFSGQPIEEALLDEILQAAVSAPSGKNRQTWRFTLIQNAVMIRNLEKTASGVIAARGEKLWGFYGPDAIILTSNDRNNSNGLADCACALQNMFLAASSLGIGSCWINGLKNIGDDPAIRALLSQWDIPENHIVWGVAALGYPASTGESTFFPHTARNVNVIKKIR
ncbi:MAG: nitroreductase [Treponema sp.]|jgi:nitroreductase|nr:nitroreductase [Treponema sp.]